MNERVKKMKKMAKMEENYAVDYDKNVKGLGWKESSHFLRNVGYLDVAIIDRHIISNMVDHGILEERPKSITKSRIG